MTPPQMSREADAFDSARAIWEAANKTEYVDSTDGIARGLPYIVEAITLVAVEIAALNDQLRNTMSDLIEQQK